ncbi:hypothetical protein [Halobacterium yunchengense]|uniref:hypothetical protein n=1 Tax=Halobacterium yunchengense TaxID=3108497 RepID=UPI003008B8B9
MAQSGAVYVALLAALTAGVAGMLAAEFFHGLDVLLWAGGGLALAAVAGITAAVSRADPPADAGH